VLVKHLSEELVASALQSVSLGKSRGAQGVGVWAQHIVKLRFDFALALESFIEVLLSLRLLVEEDCDASQAYLDVGCILLEELQFRVVEFVHGISLSVCIRPTVLPA